MKLNIKTPMTKAMLLGLGTSLALTASTVRAHDAHPGHDIGAVFTMDNDSAGNNVLVFYRAADGQLMPAGSVATGGLGTGAGLGNQSGLILHDERNVLLVVNAGSDEISVLGFGHHGLQLLDKVSSGGKQPISLTAHHDLVYVLNAGGADGDSDNITGFHLDRHGHLNPLPGSTRPLSDVNVGPAQISFNPAGNALVVTEKGTGLIDTWVMDRHGRPTSHQTFTSAGATPFGFAFGKHNELFVSEAAGGATDASSVSSYWLSPKGKLFLLDGEVPTTETAACWVVVTKDGRFIYTTNAGSGSISGYRANRWGQLSLLDPDGKSGETGAGSTPIDMALSHNSRYLYSLNSGNGTISAFRVNGHGGLEPLSGASGLPASADGLAAF